MTDGGRSVKGNFFSDGVTFPLTSLATGAIYIDMSNATHTDSDRTEHSMTSTVTNELARMAKDIEASDRIDLGWVLDYITAACYTLQGDHQEPELVAFLRALGKKVSAASTELRILEPLIREKISPAVGDEIGRIWGDPDIVSQGS